MMSDPTLFDDVVGPPPGASQRLKLTISYDGTGFRGLAPNPGVRTVVGEMAKALTPYLGYPPELVMSGRTDAGVHAAMQVLSFDVAADRADTARIQRLLNTGLGPEIVTLSVERVAADFSARLSATSRRYQYSVLNRDLPDPFKARTSWWVHEPLNLAAMRLACDPLLGLHDFSSFCRRPKSGVEGVEVSLVRQVTSARWDDLENGMLRFEITGSAFCHQMVRSIVGFHVAVGRGRRSAGELRAVLDARDRNASVSPAPPHGLCLIEVAYGN